MKATNLLLIIGLVLLLVPISFIIIAAINYTGNEEFTVLIPEEQATNMMKERVKKDFHYTTYGGHNLQVISIHTPSRDTCKGLWRDYFGNDATYQTCYEGVFMFSTTNATPSFVEGYMAKTWLLGSSTKGFEITEITKGDI